MNQQGSEKMFTWTTQKPEFKNDCLLITASRYGSDCSYNLFQIKKVDHGDGEYMAWLTSDGDEYGDLADLEAQLYFVLPLLN